MSESHIKELIEHARQGAPEEVCGLLAGKNSEVLKIYKLTNIEHSSVSYFVDPKEQFKAMKDMRQKGLKMVGIYHSHPVAPAYPSQKDVNLAFYDDVVYVIVSLMDKEPVVKGFSIKDGKITEVEIRRKK